MLTIRRNGSNVFAEVKDESGEVLLLDKFDSESEAMDFLSHLAAVLVNDFRKADPFVMRIKASC